MRWLHVRAKWRLTAIDHACQVRRGTVRAGLAATARPQGVTAKAAARYWGEFVATEAVVRGKYGASGGDARRRVVHCTRRGLRAD